MTTEGLEGPLATAELVGALTYGQLRAFQITAAAVRCAPTIPLADRLAGFAIREHERYRKLRDHLQRQTDLADRVVERQRLRFDEYFDAVRMDDWVEAVTFFAVGLPMAADFARAVARLVDDDTAAVIMSALADRADFEDFANAQLVEALGGGDEAVARLRHLVADVVGRALTGFQAAVTDSDALRVLLSGDQDGAAVKQLAIEVLHTHRERMIGLGLDDIE
ncbi:MAG: ferritin-like fold-containing protein [Nitriliruptorales bacterium]|nr:ferritin-like fold-containing protein [Nitriliruptorales bacterium]